MYTNIPIDDTIEIIKENLTTTAKINKQQIDEIILLLQIIHKQNYFTFNDKYYKQEEGLAMGSPLSGLMADIYLNHYENKYILSKHNKLHQKIIFYTRYVDYTFMIFDGTYRQIDILKKYINNINDKIKFTTEIENNETINFLDLSIYKNNNKIKYKIYRKPTTTDITIHNNSHHPHAQKMAAFNALINRAINVPMDKQHYEDEINTIKHIATVNGYKTEIIDKIIHKTKKKNRNKNITLNTINENSNTENKKYIAIEYTNLLSQTLKYEFKKLNINISFKTKNNLQKILQPKTTKEVKTSTGVYRINCDDCDKFYIGQTGRTFYDRYLEHKPKPNTKSTFAQHLIDNNHNCTNFETNLTPIHICKKGTTLDALEEFEIYRASKTEQNKILNDKLTIKSNTLYDTAIKHQNRNKR